MSATIWSQRPAAGIITGTVLDSLSGKPLEGATVMAVLSGTDSSRKIIATGAGGQFWLSDLAYGFWSLRVSSTGFSTYRMDSIHIRKDRSDFQLGDIKLWPSVEELQQVVVMVEKPLIESKDGKLTFNAAESALSGGSTTADMLKTLPMVSTDPNGKILLRGKEPRILIDDKPVELNGQQLADLLENLPGGSIERIELMQNPPPEFATDPAGVINIVTKKGRIGFTGRVNLSAGTRGEANTGINMSYRTRKWTITGTVSTGASKLLGYSNSSRNNVFADSSNRFLTSGNFENRNLRPNFRVQADYEVSKIHQLSLVLQAGNNWYDNESVTQFKHINRFDQLWRLSQRQVRSEGSGPTVNPQITWTSRPKKPGAFFRVVAGFGAGRSNSDRHFFQEYLVPATGLPTGLDSSQRQQTDNRFLNTQLRLTWHHPIIKKWLVLNLGAGVSTNRFDNSLVTQYLQKGGSGWLDAPGLSNDFTFFQWIGYAKAGLNLQTENGWRMNVYVQPEQTGFTIQNAALSDKTRSGYINWLPGITLRREWKDKHNMSLVYRKSIRRPGAGELNPAIDYGDPYNLRFGNPQLKPGSAHNFDLNYGYTQGKSYINGSVGFNLVQDIIAGMRFLQSDGKTILTYQNIASRKEYEAGVWSGYTISRSVRINASASYTYFSYRESDKLLLGYRNGGSFTTSINSSFIFSPVLTVDGNIRFASHADPQGNSRSNVNSQFGIQRKWFDRRLVTSFQVTDPFTRQEMTTTTTGKNFSLESFRSSRTRNFRLSIAWQLNRVMSNPVNSGKNK